jgi:spermidine/putrescine-binding protein
MRQSRRGFLAAAAPLVAAACTRPGSSAAAQTFAANGQGSRVQALNPNLRLAVPPSALAPTTIPGFAQTFSVHVHAVAPLPALDFAHGAADVALVDQLTFMGLVQQGLVESIDRSLVGNRRLLTPPFDDPSYDSGGHHSVPLDYTIVGFAYQELFGFLTRRPTTWAEFFHLAKLRPLRVAVPDDPSVVIGAALTALGHDWNSNSQSDLEDAYTLLLSVRKVLVVGGDVDQARIGTRAAVLATGRSFVSPPVGVSFVVPAEGTIARPRLLCIPAFAPDPVTAHAWLDYALDPFVAAADTRATSRATPVSTAVYLLPDSLLENPAVFAPAFPVVPVGFANPTPAGLAARDQIWLDFTRRDPRGR